MPVYQDYGYGSYGGGGGFGYGPLGPWDNGFNVYRTVLAGVSRTQLQSWLVTAQNAYANLMSGARVVSVGYNGKNVTYTQAGRADLEAWIFLLERALGMNRGRRPLTPIFR